MRLLRLMTSSILPLAALLLLAGCSTMAPKYSKPVSPVPKVWANSPPANSETAKKPEKPVANIPWQDFFVDTSLRKLIAMALENNRDLRVAALTIERYRVLYQIQRADFLPKVDASAGAGIQRIAEDLSGKGKSLTTHQYSAGLGVSQYELDLFGRVRSLKDQALEQYLATEQASRAIKISLISQVAAAYLSLAADRERLKLAKETLASHQESYNLVSRRYEVGVSSALDLQQARSSVEAARVDIALYTNQVALDENALALSVGSQVPSELLPTALNETLTALKDVPPGLSSEVLLLRPDILQAEGQLKAANANIGAARAALFPRITLVSSFGLGSDELGGLFKSGSLAWTFAPKISLPIFDGGSNKANVKAAEVSRDIMVAQYEKAIQTAFREVADGLSRQSTIDEQLSAQQSLADATNERYNLSLARFEKGVDSHLNVLDSQRSLYSARQGLIGVRLTKLANMVTLYKVLGGGGE